MKGPARVAICLLVAHAWIWPGLPKAQALSCAAPAPARMQLVAADAGFVGTVLSSEKVDPPPGGFPYSSVKLRIRVDRILKGSVDQEVLAEAGQCSSGEGLKVGDVTGVVVNIHEFRIDFQFTDPEALIEAARPLRADPKAGPPIAVLSGMLGEASVMSVDEHGRVVAFGMGSGSWGQLSICPRNEKVVQYIDELVLRDLRTLQIIRTAGIPPQKVVAMHCAEPDGSRVLMWIVTRTAGGISSVIYENFGTGFRELWSGSAMAVDFSKNTDYAYIVLENPEGKILRLDLSTGRANEVGTLPKPVSQVSLSPDERHVAATGQVYLINLRSGKWREFRVPDEHPGESRVGKPQWIDNRTFLVPGWPARIFDTNLRQIGRIEGFWGYGGEGWSAILQGRVLSTAGLEREPGGGLKVADLPNGRVKRLPIYKSVYPRVIEAINDGSPTVLGRPFQLMPFLVPVAVAIIIASLVAVQRLKVKKRGDTRT